MENPRPSHWPSLYLVAKTAFHMAVPTKCKNSLLPLGFSSLAAGIYLLEYNCSDCVVRSAQHIRVSLDPFRFLPYFLP